MQSFKPKYKHREISFDRLIGDLREGANQVRDIRADGYRASAMKSQSQEQIEELVKALKNGADGLDAIIVHPHGDEYAELNYLTKNINKQCFHVVDGHHRLAAYRQAYQKGILVSKRVKVKVLQGASRTQARELARSINQKSHINMSQPQKIQEAWLSFWRNWGRYSEMSCRKIATEMGGMIGHQTACNMKNTIKEALNSSEKEELSKQLNSNNPEVEPWNIFSRKYSPEASELDREEQKKKAEWKVWEKLNRVAYGRDWALLDDVQKEKLICILLGESYVLIPTEQYEEASKGEKTRVIRSPTPEGLDEW